MRAERNTLTAVDADKGFLVRAEIDGVKGAGRSAGATADAQLFAHNNPAALALGICPAGAGGRAGSRIAGHADPGFKTGGQSTAGGNANTCPVPGKGAMHQAGTGERAAVATNAALHVTG